jgi:XTP/dITP diphosphohydrolase
VKNRNNTTKLVFATNNRHKFIEIEKALGATLELLNLNDLGFTGESPEEQGTLEGNAAQKAYFIFNKYGLNCFADDTGLEIEALHGEPGVFSARYAEANRNFEDNMNKVLENMKGMTNRNARFRTQIALVERGKLTTFAGEVRGVITLKKRQPGIRVRPVFQPRFERTFAEMSLRKRTGSSLHWPYRSLSTISQ